MSNSKSNTENTEVENSIDDSLEKAILTYKKIYEKEEMTKKQEQEIEQACETITNRQIITRSVDHKSVEIKNSTDTIITGPPTLTRFEKARIMGSRALQLSLGAPPFIEFSKNISTSLEIAMEE